MKAQRRVTPSARSATTVADTPIGGLTDAGPPHADPPGGSNGSRRLRLIQVASAEPAAWDALAVRSARGEVLQSHAWGALKSASGWTVRRYRVEDASGPVAVVSIQERDLASPVIRHLPRAMRGSQLLGASAGRFLYAPFGPVLLREGREAAEATLRALRTIARRRLAALLVIDPSWEIDTELAGALTASRFRPSRRPIQVSTTGMLVPLEAEDAAQRKHLNENTRRNLDRARKAGVEIVRFDAASPGPGLARALDVAYDMLAQTGERKGFGLYLRPREYHNPAQQSLIEAGHASLWFARHEGRDVAHTLVHHCGARALLYLGGEAEAVQGRVPANFLLQWSIMRWAAAGGFASYDMGGVDNHAAPGLPHDESHPMWNLMRFKSQWGARPTQFVGAWEYAPWPVLGAGLRAAWSTSDRLRRRRDAGA
jgi:lipid II:glycine glycyltransferase (peptidoglycan interpeptide bridge formation enzyme)